MKKLLSLSLLLVLPLLMAMGGEPSAEPSPATPAAPAFAIVDTALIYTESTMGQEGFALIQSMQANAEAELVLLEQRISELDESDESKAMRIQLELQPAAYALQEVFDQYQQSVITTLNDSLLAAIETVRAEKGLAVVFPSDIALAYTPEYDITQDVLAVVNATEVSFEPMPEVSIPAPTPLDSAEESAESSESSEESAE